MRWEISGRFRVWENFTPPTTTHSTRDLAGVRYEIATSTIKRGGWKKIRAGFAGSRGRFSYDWNAPNEKRRRFRVRIFFDDNRLTVRPWRLLSMEAKPLRSVDTPAYLVHRDDTFRSNGPDADFGNLVITEDDGPFDMGRKRVYRQAVIWYVMRTLQDALEDQAPWLGFNKRLKVICPADTHTWAGGNTVHITPKHFKIGTLIHEAMHIWNYQHNHGTTNWACSMGKTHGRQEKPNIAFHEGFAEWASDEIISLLWRGNRITEQLPYNRKWLYDEHRLADLDELERSDDGVSSALRLLTTPHVYRLRFGTSEDAPPDNDGSRVTHLEVSDVAGLNCASAPDFSVWELLSVFRADPDLGWNKDWQVGKGTYGLRRFYARVSDYYPERFDDATRQAFLRVMNPASADEPQWTCTALTEDAEQWLEPTD